MMKKKIYIPLFGLIIILSGWWFLRTETAPTPEESVLDVWVTWGDSPEQLQTLFNRFGNSYGITVKVRTQVREDELQDALTSPQPPDLVVLSSNQPVQTYSEQGLIEQLGAWIDRLGINLEDFYPAPLAQCTNLEGGLSCLPWGGDVFALYWNKDLFSETGLDPEQPPQTMEELVQYAKKLSLINEDGKIIRMGFMPDFPRSHSDLYARMYGGSWLNDEGTRLTINSSPVIDAMNWQSQFLQGYVTSEMKKFNLSVNRYINSNHPMFGEARLNCQQCHRAALKGEKNVPDHSFYDGKVAMMVDGQWQITATHLTQLQSDLNFGAAPFPYPSNHPERAGTTIVQGPVVIIPIRAVDKNLSVNLLTWMMSPEAVADISFANGMLPTNRTAAEDPRFQQIAYFDLFMNLMDSPDASFTPASIFSEDVNRVIREAEKEIFYQNGESAKTVLDQMQTNFTP